MGQHVSVDGIVQYSSRDSSSGKTVVSCTQVNGAMECCDAGMVQVRV